MSGVPDERIVAGNGDDGSSGSAETGNRYSSGLGSKRDHGAWVYIRTFLPMLHEGAMRMKTVRRLKRESALTKLSGIHRIPRSDALED